MQKILSYVHFLCLTICENLFCLHYFILAFIQIILDCAGSIFQEMIKSVFIDLINFEARCDSCKTVVFSCLIRYDKLLSTDVVAIKLISRLLLYLLISFELELAVETSFTFNCEVTQIAVESSLHLCEIQIFTYLQSNSLSFTSFDTLQHPLTCEFYQQLMSLDQLII